MFKGETGSSLSSEPDIFEYVEGYDVFNSSFIFALDNNDEYGFITITKFENRLDLINQYLIYGDKGKYGLLGINNRIFSHQELTNGKRLRKINEIKMSEIKSKST